MSSENVHAALAGSDAQPRTATQVQVAGSQGIGNITAVSAVGANDVLVMTSGGFVKEHTASWFSYN